MEVKKFEVEVPFGQIVYAVLPEEGEDCETRYVATCKVIGACCRFSQRGDIPSKKVLFAKVLDGYYKGRVINDLDELDTLYCAGNFDYEYTLFDNKETAQDIADDINRNVG